MERNSTTFLKGFCRTCLNGNEENKEMEGKAISIFSNAESIECENTTIMELLMLTTPQLNIDNGDMLPKIVCERCLESLLNAYKFQKMCLRVEQRLREMIKEIHAQSQTNEDPLKVISSDNISVFCPNDLTNISKVNQSFIDQNEVTFNDRIVIEDSEGIRFKMEKSRRENISDSDFLGEVHSDTDECEISFNSAKCKKGNEIVINIDTAFTKEQPISKITKDCRNNLKTITNAMNCQKKNFKCDECGNRLLTRSSLNRHKKIHLCTVSVSKRKKEIVKSKDFAATKEQQISEITKDCTKNLKTINNAINSQNKKFKCDDCGHNLSTLWSLNRHKKIHIRRVSVSQENTLDETEKNGSFNSETDETKIVDIIEKEKPAFETTNGVEEREWEDISDSDGSDEIDSDLDQLEISSNNADCNEIVKNNDVAATKEQEISNKTKDCTNNLKAINNAINSQNNNFKCNECDVQLSTLWSLNRHKKMHIREVSVSQENTLYETEMNGSLNFECDETKIVDIIEKEKPAIERTNSAEEKEREDISDSENFDEVDSDLDEWEISSNNAKCKKDNEMVKNKDASVTKEQEISEIAKDYTKDLKTINNAINSQNNNFKCNQCGNSLSTRSSLNRHKKIHLRTLSVNQENKLEETEKGGSNNFECDGKKIEKENQTSEATKSLKETSGKDANESDDFDEIDSDMDCQNKNFKCDECGNRYSARSSLKQHKKNHLSIKTCKPKNFKCDKCGKLLASRITLKRHNKKMHLMKAGEGESNLFNCDECGKIYSTSKYLIRHKKIHLKNAKVDRKKSSVKRKYECGVCQKVFHRSYALRMHRRIHTSELPYLCPKCGKAFRTMGMFKQHFMRHGTDRPYQCPDCPKRFVCSSNLNAHKAAHNKKEKNHVCDICGAAFIQANVLKKHKVYHSDDRNHKCDYCDMRFYKIDSCRRHMRIHTGEKPYKCKYCETAYAQSNDLMKHMRVHLGNNVYKCDLCPKGFPLQRELRAHFYTHKNDDEETKARNLQALKDEQERLQTKFGLNKCT